MENYVTGAVIKALREKQNLTQKELAEQIGVSDKTVSKWETGKGLPDITLLEPLAGALGVSVTELLAGEIRVNTNRAGNMLRSKFYVCPVCGNVIHAVGPAPSGGGGARCGPRHFSGKDGGRLVYYHGPPHDKSPPHHLLRLCDR